MTDAMSTARDALLAEFEDAWRDGAPVFACCRRTVATAVEHTDMLELAAADPTRRVHMLRDPVELVHPGHLETHRCCAGHVVDLALDAPDLIATPAHIG